MLLTFVMTVRFDKKQMAAVEKPLFHTRVPVRFQDVDAAGIVFFARMFDYVHAAYEEFLAAAGHPLPRVIAEGKWAAPLRHAEADYLSPARFGDVLLVDLVLADVADAEITLGFRLQRSPDAPRPTAVVQTVHSFVSLPDFKRCPVPEEIRAYLRPTSG